MLSMEGYFWIVLAIFFGVALLFSCCGFKKFVWFLSVGYGLAIFGIGVTALILGFGKFPFSKVVSFDWPTLLLSILLVLYGLRLSSFLIYREAKSLSYRKTLEKVAGEEEKKMPFFLKATIWIFCSVLYVMETFPVLYRLEMNATTQTATGFILPLIGFIIACIGLIIETTADLQKNAAKKKNPHEFVSSGLYRWVRCPNYAGEIIFWTGIFVSGTDLFQADWLAWIIAILGYLLIVYVMLSGAKRLEGRQLKNYGNEEAFRSYIAKTPLLFRLIPLKSLQHWDWIK